MVYGESDWWCPSADGADNIADIGRWSLGTGNVGTMCRGTTRLLIVVWNCEVTGVMDDREKAEGLLRIKRTETMLRC